MKSLRTLRVLSRGAWTALSRCCLLSLSLLVGCSAIDVESEFALDARLQASILDQSEDRYAHIDPLFIDEAVKQRLDAYIGNSRDERTRIERLQSFMYDEEQLGIIYSGEKTHTAMELLASRSGNCLSAMHLYVALARYLGVEARFQRVDVQPSWDKRGNLLVLSQHINATGRFDTTVRYVADFTPEIALQQLTSVVLTDVEARSLYFNNLGVEALIAGDYPGAVSYLKNSLFLNNENSIAWNNIGAAYNRLGEGDLAEYSYRTSFELDANSSTAVGNLAKFYRARGELKRAAEFELAIERFNKKNPYYHFAQGHLAYDQGDLLAAQKSFEQAIELKEEEPDFYLALRQVYFDQGELSKASELRRQALALVNSFAEIYRPSDERLRVLDSHIPQRGESDVRRRLIMPE